MINWTEKVLFATLFGLSCLGYGGNVLAPPLNNYGIDKKQPLVSIVKDGEAKAVVVVGSPKNRYFKEVQKQAIDELVEHIKKSTGATLKVVNSKNYKGGAAIFLGNSPAAAKAGFKFDNLEPEHFRIMTKNGNLAIIGNDAEEISIKGANGKNVREQMDSRGTLFGVYDFLERYLDARWYFAGELGSFIKKDKNLVIAPCNYENGPVYLRRHVWSKQLRENKKLALRWRLGMGIGIGNHSHDNWVRKYANRPELFALKLDGSREMKYFGGQLDYTNPEVKKLELDHLKNFYKTGDKSPWKHRAPRNSYFIEFPNDCMVENQVPAFQKYIKSYKGKYPQFQLYSKPVHKFYSELARDAEKLWPEKYMLFGAYSKYTFPAEGVDYRPNMIAEVCIMDGPAFFKEPEKYKLWLDVLRKYKDLTGNKPYSWEYPTWPMETTNMPLIFPRLVNRWHRDAKEICSGAFLCGLMRSFPQDHLNAYFWLKSMWNPDFDVQAALDEYYKNCYGPAAPVMKQYFDLLIDRWENVIWNVPCGRSGGLPLDKVYQETYSPKIRKQLKTLELKALKLAPEGSDFHKRVKQVVDSQKAFYTEAELYDRLGRGAVLYVPEATPEKLDGKLSDKCWNIIGLQMCERDSGKDAKVKSLVKMCYDNENLYIGCDFTEPFMKKLKAQAAKHDESAWNDDGIEIFISPQQYPDHYVQIAINTKGVIFDGWKEAIAGFTTKKDFKIKRHINKEEGGFTMEVAIPWRELAIAAPAKGNSMRANVIRNRKTGKRRSEIYAMSPTFKQSNHNTKFFGTLIFTGQDRLSEDFGRSTKCKWRAFVIGSKDDPQAKVSFTIDDGYGKLAAMMSKTFHVAQVSTNPRTILKKGDLIEVRYRGPFAKHYGRLSVSFKLKTGKESKFAWTSDRRDLEKGKWRNFVIDPFKLSGIKDDHAELIFMALKLASVKRKENSMDIDYVRISPYTVANVK